MGISSKHLNLIPQRIIKLINLNQIKIKNLLIRRILTIKSNREYTLLEIHILMQYQIVENIEMHYRKVNL